MLQFQEIIYGPVQSRRLGNSLGINLLPIDAKICTFNCIYCECGFNTTMKDFPMPVRADVRSALEAKLQELSAENQSIDVITFAGNGEPTLHPDFELIIDDTIALRDRFLPQTRIGVLTNSTQIGREQVFRALLKVDSAILKFDSAIDSTVKLIDQPANPNFSVGFLMENLRNFGKKLIVQTMFLRGEYAGKTVDNTTETELSAYINALQMLNPQQVMIYTIARETPVRSLQKIPLAELEHIAQKIRQIGIPVSVAD